MLKSGPAAGIFWMCMATLISSISGAMVRELAGEIPTFELVFFRNVIAMTVLIPIVLRQGVGLPDRSQLPYYGMRILFAFSAMVFLFYALARMPLADVYALQYTIPLFTILLAVMFLRQKADIHSWAAVFVGFVGTLIVMRPGIIEITLAALGAITAACLSAGSNTTIKILARKDNAEAITLWTNIGMLPLALIPTIFVWVTPTAEQWPLIIGVGVVSSIGGYCFTRAVSAADARIVQPFQFSRMVFATAIGWIMFSEFPDLWTWVGAAVIFGASYYIVYREGLARKAAKASQQAAD
ncbi:MAG: drug/metabolite transporter (DMT)-like permease [Paracoccaceae bacterium]|jgi:drug/metabolite transporter (DMT)-like permease